MLRFEREALARFDLVLAVSEADGDTFERLYPGALRAPVHVVQTGVDTQYFRPASGHAGAARAPRLHRVDGLAAERRRHALFRPRHPAAASAQAEPGATLSIIGRAPTPAVQRLADEHGIEVTGRVDDVRPHVAAGSVYVVPLRIGGGTRLKIFEAMAHGQGRRLDHHRRRGSAGHRRRATSSSPTSPQRSPQAVVRLIRDDAARQPHRDARRGGSSSSATTGRPSPRTSRTRWRASPTGTRRRLPVRPRRQRGGPDSFVGSI